MSGNPLRLTLDTNVLVYAFDNLAGIRHSIAQTVVQRAARCGGCQLALQSISEFYAAITKRGRVPRPIAATQAMDFLDLFPDPMPPSAAAVRTALVASAAGRASYWDALLLATVAENGCPAILSEDMQDGELIEGVRVINPFGTRGLSTAAERLFAELES